jgi:hypothetical protein
MSRGPSCSWCISPFRQVAEDAIAGGMPVSHVCVQYGLSRNQWRKHKGHASLVESTVVSLAGVRRDVVEGGGGPYTVIPRLESLLIDVEAAKQKWQSRPATIVQLLRLERDILGDIAKLRGEFPQMRSMQVGDWAEWRLVIDALTPYPKAMHAVSLALTDGTDQ